MITVQCRVPFLAGVLHYSMHTVMYSALDHCHRAIPHGNSESVCHESHRNTFRSVAGAVPGLMLPHAHYPGWEAWHCFGVTRVVAG